LKKLSREVIRELERKVILKALQANHWNRKKAARALCISYRGLLYKIRSADLCPSRSSRPRQEAVAAQ
jgi:DNA-binding NtrC family response regulator